MLRSGKAQRGELESKKAQMDDRDLIIKNLEARLHDAQQQHARRQRVLEQKQTQPAPCWHASTPS